VIADRAHLHLSFAAEALEEDRRPTSYAGALAELGARFDEPAGPFEDALAGELPVLLEARAKHELQRALAFASERRLQGAVYGTARAGELAEELRATGLAVVLPPFDPGFEQRSLEAVGRLADAGVPFGFSLDAPQRHPASLRLAAAACMRAGLGRDAAWRALTVDAARIAGVHERIGQLQAGMDADMVVWSGDSLDLASRVVAVYVDGELVHGGAE
jgi:imidazolonepropionase-like amidohydrolase